MLWEPPVMSQNHISRKNKDDALDNIGRKIALLQIWIKDGQPQDVRPSEIPTSLRQFNAWTITVDKEYGFSFRANSAATLRQEEALTKQVLFLIDAIREVSSAKRKRRPLGDLGHLQQEVKLERSRRLVVERKFVSARRDLEKAQKAHEILRNQLSNLEKEAKEALNSRNCEISELKRENRELIAKMANLAPLRRKN
jgi:hypothetical protein